MEENDERVIEIMIMMLRAECKSYGSVAGSPRFTWINGR